MNKEAFYSELETFLKKRNPEVQGIPITADTNLIQEGIIDSFSVVELIIFIESITRKKLEVEQLNSKSIETLKSIYEYFIKNSY